MHYIILDQETLDQFAKSANNRVLCKINNQIEFHCAIISKKEGGGFIYIGSKIRKELKINAGSKVTAVFKADNSKYQFEMPEELEEVLKTDLDAHTKFHSLTAGNQRSLIYLVMQVKSSEKRIERALKIAEKIKNGITSPREIFK